MKTILSSAAILLWASMPILAQERPQAPITDLGKSFSDLVGDGWTATGAVIAMEYLLMEKDGAYAVCTLQIGGGMSLYPKPETTSVASACYKVTN